MSGSTIQGGNFPRAMLQPVSAGSTRPQAGSTTPSAKPADPTAPPEAPQANASLTDLASPRTRASNEGLKNLLSRADSILASQNRMLDDAQSLLGPKAASTAYTNAMTL